MNETLKGVANIGAELAAAKAELQQQHEAHRKTWRQLEQAEALIKRAADIAEARERGYTQRQNGHVVNGRCADSLVAMLPELHAALSLQAEPECPHCHGHGLDSPEGSAPCRLCIKDEPAPAQDERDAFEVDIPEIIGVLYRSIDDESPCIKFTGDQNMSIKDGDAVMTVAQHLQIEKQLRAALSATPSPAMDAKEEI